MQNLFLGLHTAMVPVILAVGALALICGIALLVMTRAGSAQAAQAAQSPAPAGASASAGGSSAGLGRVFRILLSILAVLGVLQAIFGALLFVQGDRPAEGLHFVYGLIVLGAIPVAYVYSDQKEVRRDIIIMSIAVVAVIGAAVRALMTG